MIYSNLSSTLQFVGALYVTIVFDSILFRRFWAPNYYTILQKHIKSYNLPVTKELNDWMTNHIKEKNHIFQENSRKRGAIFLTATLIMLISIGIIDNLDCVLTSPFMVLLIASYLILFIMPKYLHRWVWLIFALFVESILYIITLKLQPVVLPIEEYILIIRTAIIIFIIIPIFYQIIRSWSFSTAMQCFVIEKLKFVSNNYFKAKEAILRKDKTLIPECYKGAFSQMAFDVPNEDLQLTQINEQLLEELKSIFNKISFAKLFMAYWRNPIVEEMNAVTTLIDENDSVDQFRVNHSISTNVNQMKELAFEYERMKRRPTIEQFCLERKIDIDTFREFRKSKKCKTIL